MDKNVDRLFSWLVLSYHIIQLKAIEIGHALVQAEANQDEVGAPGKINR